MTVSGRIALLVLALAATGGLSASASSSEFAAPDEPTLSTDLLPWSKDTSATFQFSSSSDAVAFTCGLDSEAAEDCASPKSYTALSQGAHAFEVRARDSAGELSPPSTFEWTIDLTAPGLPADVVVEATSPAGAIVVFGTSDNLDPSPVLNCGSHDSGSTFPLGVTNVSCTVTDAAGNVSNGSFTVEVEDTTPPTLAPRPDVIRDQESAQGAVVHYALPDAQDIADASPEVECDPPPQSTFPIGETEVTCSATDAAGLESQPTTFKVIVQQGQIPAKPGIVPSVPRLTRLSEVTFELDLEPGGSAECRLEGPSQPGSFTPCDGATQAYAGLVDGAHLFTVQVTNGVGNVNQASYGWTVDLTSPARVVGFSPRARRRIVTLSWTKPIDVDYDRVRIWRKRAAARAWKPIADRVEADSFTDRAVSNHVRYLYRIRSFDVAGNVSAGVTLSAWPTPIVSPQYDAIVHSAPLVDWASVKNATYYNMQLWRDGRKLLSVWPGGSQHRLRSSWTFQGRRHMLSGGRVIVYVWAGFGPKAAARYGPLFGQTRFEVG